MRFEEVHAVRCDRCLHAVSHCHGAPRAEPGDDGCLVCYVDCDITCVTRELGEVLVRGGLWDVERQVHHQVRAEWLDEFRHRPQCAALDSPGEGGVLDVLGPHADDDLAVDVACERGTRGEDGPGHLQ